MLKAGDIVLVSGKSWPARAILSLTTKFGEARSKISHVGIMVDETNVVEAVFGGVKKRDFMETYKDSNVIVTRCTTLSPKDIEAIVKRAEGYVHKKYGYLKLGLHALDWLLQGAYVFRRLGGMDNYPICSYLVAQSYAQCNLNFGVAPGAASPDDIWDYVVGHPDRYDPILMLGEL